MLDLLHQMMTLFSWMLKLKLEILRSRLLPKIYEQIITKDMLPINKAVAFEKDNKQHQKR